MNGLILGDPHVWAASGSPNLIHPSLARHVSLRRNGQVLVARILDGGVTSRQLGQSITCEEKHWELLRWQMYSVPCAG